MDVLAGIHCPEDLRRLSTAELETLAQEIREFLIEHVAATGGHLGPNLGVVELSIALHRVFDSPREPIIFDTSHQSYVHKILTGRAEKFESLRQKGGLSGYTSRSESEHDWTESSHASAALSYADGLSKAKVLQGRAKDNVIAVVGDGALTGGMCWEALNNIAADQHRNVVIVVNDNGRSYAPTIGGFAENLAQLRMQPVYDSVMEHGKNTLNNMGWVGRRTFEALHAFKEGVKSTVLPGEMFPELGMKYVGPVDGHDLEAVEEALTYAYDFSGPIIVHVVTEKGRGFAPAEADTAELMHTTGVIDPVTGEPKTTAEPGWTPVFSDELVAIAEERKDVIAITAAMAGPTGLLPFKDRFPDRFFDVGIAEQHAVTSAAGLALGGMKPVVALYSTFLNRAIDQLIMDVGLIRQPVTLVLDRAGITGNDGASHNGIWDISLTSVIPGMRIAAPRDGQQLKELLREAVAFEEGPSVVRFPKGSVPADTPAQRRYADGVDVLAHIPSPGEDEGALKVLLIGTGTFSVNLADIADDIAHEGVEVTVIDPRWICPIPDTVVDLARAHDLVITAEDGMIHGGFGSLVSETLSEHGIDVPRRSLGFPAIYPDHASRGEMLADLGLDSAGMKKRILAWIKDLA
ncbi:1-deoxy-D-xylulose-5-phosphate synthase [Corynebacterium sp. 3HC-13]|uniref:1-deoxy-D-xylulose-5-phosphate synthase n=1 Tax=Corynebacterium poyangense TaxID=2684405 RepID=UPI001CCF9D0B|nr:1-deoxy-D-xylulose-5-phosphate synthase [Corynebacterium poyangense]MBZ8177921.1 1-deoxy-D-xylulose-5-phosphate synthase [Corynebacterium poyangense]